MNLLGLFKRGPAPEPTRVIRRPWVTNSEAVATLQGRGDEAVVTVLLNLASRREETYRSRGDMLGLDADARAFLQGGATALREWQEMVEMLCAGKPLPGGPEVRDR
jgi:hypothetical protein